MQWTPVRSLELYGSQGASLYYKPLWARMRRLTSDRGFLMTIHSMMDVARERAYLAQSEKP